MFRQVGRAILRTRTASVPPRMVSVVSYMRMQLTLSISEHQNAIPVVNSADKSAEIVSAESSQSSESSTTSNSIQSNAQSNRTPRQQKKPGNGQKSTSRPRQKGNKKVQDISRQIREVIKADSVLDLSESIQILEEGITYLRQVQNTENITELDIYAGFQGAVNDLVTKALSEEGAGLGGDRSLTDLLEILVNHRIAGSYNFAQIMAHEIKSAESNNVALAGYEKALDLWVLFTQYRRDQPLLTRFVSRSLDGKFWNSDVLYLAYYAYMLTIFASQSEFDPQTTLKIFQLQDFPSAYYVGQTIVRMQIKPDYKSYASGFGSQVNNLSLKTLDPNGDIAISKLAAAAKRQSLLTVLKAHREIVNAASTNGISIKESTLVRIMKAYKLVEAYDNVFAVFQEMIAGGIAKPSAEVWEVVLSSYSAPHHIKGKSQDERKTLAVNIGQFILTIEGNGTEVTPRLVAAFVESYANLGCFDEVEAILKKYQHLSMLEMTKNKLIIGYLINGETAVAEQKLQQFSEESSKYVTTTAVINAFLQAYVKAERLEQVEKTLKYADEKGIAYDWATLNILLHMYLTKCIEKGQEPSSQTIYEYFKDATNRGIRAFSPYTVNTLMTSLFDLGAHIETLRAMHQFAKGQNLESLAVVSTMINAELALGLVEIASRLFTNQLKKYKCLSREWNMFLNGLLKRGDSIGALKWLDTMKKQETVQPNFFTYYFFLSHFDKKKDRAVVQQLINDLNGGQLQNFGDKLGLMLKELKGRGYDVHVETLEATELADL